MKIKSESEILDPDIRKQILIEINQDENQKRKSEMKKRYDVFKDKTGKFVLEKLEKEVRRETLEQMVHRVSNLSILRKIIDKRAMVYKDGAIREIASEENFDDRQDQLSQVSDLININSVMKKVNRYFELFKNCTVYVRPSFNVDTNKADITLRVLPPFLYDVVEDAENPEIGRVFIFSYYNGEKQSMSARDPGLSGTRSTKSPSNQFRDGDGFDQILADAPDDFGSNYERYVWWSDNLHFTTNGKGEIISGEDIENPIGKIPFVNFADDQDGKFWAVGGDDLTEGSILINQLLTDMYLISKMQGMGVMYAQGKNLPPHLDISPNQVLLFEQNEGDPDLKIGYLSSNPPLGDHMRMIEQYLAMLLSTNNLEPGTVQGQLSATAAASGVQEMIRKSENIDDIEEQRQMYKDLEPEIIDMVSRWERLLWERGLLNEKWDNIGLLPDDFDYVLKFPESRRIMTDMDKLAIIEKRRDLKLDTMIDSLRRDNPDLSENEAREKIAEIRLEKMENYFSAFEVQNGNPKESSNEENTSESDEGLEQPDTGSEAST